MPTFTRGVGKGRRYNPGRICVLQEVKRGYCCAQEVGDFPGSSASPLTWLAAQLGMTAGWAGEHRRAGIFYGNAFVDAVSGEKSPAMGS